MVDMAESKEREARSVALEKAYVHDVYQQIAWQTITGRIPEQVSSRTRPKVKQFLLDLEPGSVICDVGCGNGKYLSFNPFIFKIGLDNCSNLTKVARQKDHEIILSDNLALPFRDECFDAVISIAVIHHFATTERRVAALKELARILKIGGRLMVSVWSMEQRHRKWSSSSQDVLVPWTRPLTSSSDDKTSLNTSSAGSDEDCRHYHAYTQTSDSDSLQNAFNTRKRRQRSKGRRSIDPTCPSTSSSDLSSPNETCYSFVRRALQKLAGTKRSRRRPWFLQGFEQPVEGLDFDGNMHNLNLNSPDRFMPIELRQLESTEFIENNEDNLQEDSAAKNPAEGLLFSNILYPRRNTSPIPPTVNPVEAQQQQKSKSLSSLIGIFQRPPSRKPADGDLKTEKQNTSIFGNPNQQVFRSQSSLSRVFSTNDDNEDRNTNENFDCHSKAVQTGSLDSINLSSTSKTSLALGDGTCDTLPSQDTHTTMNKPRPVLVKQKHSISSSSSQQQQQQQQCTDNIATGENIENKSSNYSENAGCQLESLHNDTQQQQNATGWGEMKKSIQDLPEFRLELSSSNSFCNNPPPPPPPPPPLPLSPTTSTSTNTRHNSDGCNPFQPNSSSSRAVGSGSSFWKQTSLNEELIFSERLKEKERLKQHLQKQCSLNEEFIYKQRENNNTRWDQMKEAFLNSSNVKCLQLLKAGLSTRFRGTTTTTTSGGGVVGGDNSSNAETFVHHNIGNSVQGTPVVTSIHHNNFNNVNSAPSSSSSSTFSSSSTSLRHGFVKTWMDWTNTTNRNSTTGNMSNSNNVNSGVVPPSTPLSASSFLSSRRSKGLFPPFFHRRSSVGSLNLSNKKETIEINSSENEDNGMIVGGCGGGSSSMNNNGNNKLLPVRHVRKLSKEDGSDSSKDSSSSFQSDTSVDSEDSSFASVIFIPKADASFNSDTRANSTDSDRSPKLSPPSNNNPKSPSPLATEIVRRKSPEVSPTRLNLYGASNLLETNRFVFDESTVNVSPTPTHPHPHFFLESNNPSHNNNNPCIPTVTTTTTNNNMSNKASCVNMITSKNMNTKELNTTLLESVNEEGEREPEFPVQTTIAAIVENPLSRNIISHKNTSCESSSNNTTEGETMTTISTPTTSSSNRKHNKVEKIEVLRKPANLPEQSTYTRQLVRRTLPKILAVELYNPETDDVDTTDSSSSSSSPNSVSSVVSVVNEDVISTKSISFHVESSESSQKDVTTDPSLCTLPSDTSQHLIQLLPSISEDSTSFENVPTLQTSPKTRAKFTTKLGSTSEWLSSLPSSSSSCEMSPQNSISSSSGSCSRRHTSTCKRNSGDKTLIKKEPDAKWPTMAIDESPSQQQQTISPSSNNNDITNTTIQKQISSEIQEEIKELEDSLYDSTENLTNNPSIDSSIRMSSTCSCSIRGGDSFESWTSARSSLTNSSSISKSSSKHKPSFPSSSFTHMPPNKPTSINIHPTVAEKMDNIRGDAGSTASEESTAITYHRYYHCFREGELDKLIQKYVQNLHIISSYYDHNWCVVCEKVQVWTI